VPYVERAGATIWWDALGAGPALLLVQGLGYPSDAWWRLRPALSERHRTIAFDNRGVGRTGVPAEPFSIDDMADDAAAVIRAAGETAADVFGASMGGIIAQELALRHPSLVRSLILGCTGPGGRDAVLADPGAAGFLAARAGMTAREAAVASIPWVYADATPQEEIMADIDVRMTRPTSADGYSAQLRAVMAHGGTLPRLRDLAVPTLIIHGTADRLVPPANADLLAGAIPGAEQVMLDGAGHIFTTERRAETVRAVLRFLDAR
jgi:pimeloyl-ACP methyl ester carboxylesterase